jgi:predicted nuclease of predicted toxin-antitoxin system
VIKFHLDENVDHAIALGLRLRGLDVTTATDAGLIAAVDQEHIKFATAEHRVIFTQDQDFLRRHAVGDSHDGIVYSQQGSHSVGDIVRFLHFLSDCLEPDDMHGQLEFLC